MDDVIERLLRLEERFVHVQVAGWRNASGDARSLEGEAAALETLGLPELAARVRCVARAEGPLEALAAISLASVASTMLRARIGGDAPPAGEWAPMRQQRSHSGAKRDTLLPLARVAFEGGEAWACVQLGTEDSGCRMGK